MAGEFISDEEVEKLEGGKVNPTNARAAAKTEMDLLKKFKELGHKTATPEFFKDILNFGTGVLDQTSLENLRYRPAFQQALDEAKTESPRSTMTGQGAGLAGVTAASMALPALSAAKALRIGPLVTGAIQGAATKPEGSDDLSGDLSSRAKQAAVAPLVSGAVRGLGVGAKKVGDVGMQVAVGRNKITPGAGTELVNAGVFRPTREGMRQQVSRKKAETFKKMEDSVAGNSSLNQSAPVADSVRGVGRRMEIPGAAPSAADKAALSEVSSFADDIASRGAETPSQMLGRRAAAGNRAFDNVSEMAKKNFLGTLSKEEQKAYSRIIKSAAPEIIPHDKRYAALAKAGKALNKETPALQGWGVPGLATKAAMTYGSFSVNPLAAIPAFALSTPGGQAAASHLFTRLGQAAPYAAPASVAGAANLVGGTGKRGGTFISDEEMEAMESGGNESDRRAKRASGDKEGSARFLGIKKKDLEAIEKIPMPAKQRSRSAR